MKIEQQAERIWPLLARAARRRRILTYATVADPLGVPPIGLARPLARILDLCRERGYPPLTVLVVNRRTGRPGGGYCGPADLDRSREEVYAFRWGDVPRPTRGDFEGGR